MTYLSHALAWAELHPLALAVILWLLTSLVVAVTPERYRRQGWYAWVVRVADRLSVLTHSDSPGTLKLPGIASAIDPRAPAWIATVRNVTVTPTGAPMGQRASGAPPSQPGFASVTTLAWSSLIGLAMLVALSHAGCSGTQLDRSMRSADALGLAANRAEPLWISVYRLEGQRAADRACPPAQASDPVCSASRLVAVHAVTARWFRVHLQWEQARMAHDGLAGCLEAARASDGGLCPDEGARQAALSAAITLYRCEVHAVGHPELDLLGSTPLSCPASDAGVSS